MPIDLTTPAGYAAALSNEKLVVRIKEEARDSVRAERQPRHEPLRALSVQELFDRPRPDYLIDQLLPEGALAEFVGDSETLKSFVAIDLGMTIASDRRKEFFGLRVVKHGPVVYIAAEGAGAFQYRLRVWGTKHGAPITTVPFFTIAAPINLRDTTFQAELEAIVADKKPLLIIVDTLHRCIPGAEENSSRDLGEVVGFATRLQAQYRVAILFLHHPPKSDPSGRGRGSGALYYAADTELNSVIEADTEQPDGTKVVNVSVVKQKDDSKVSFKLANRIVPVCDEHGRPMCHESGRDITSCVLELATEEDMVAAEDVLPQRILAFLRANPGSIAREIRDGVKANKGTVVDVVEFLKAGGRIEQKQVKRGRTWRSEFSVPLDGM